MNEVMQAAIADAEARTASEGELSRLKSMAESLTKAQRDVEEKEAALKKAKAEVTRLEQIDIPTLAREIGITDFSTEDGYSFSIKPDISCSISVERRAAAHAWLRDHGFGGIIKSRISVLVPPKQQDSLAAIQEAISDVSDEYDLDLGAEEKVEPQTLKAFLKERIEAGDDIPRETFGIHEYYKTKAKAPKAK